jgi:Cd2+/Zn2+-exporting ATPase
MAEAFVMKSLAASSTLQVTGMDCADCATKVEKAVKLMPGVISVQIAFPLGKLRVEYDATQTGLKQVIDKIKTLGYDANAATMSKEASFWKSNQYVIPTIISLLMLLIGLGTERIVVASIVPTVFFLIGIILGGFLPAKNGISVLLNVRELDMNILMTIAVVGAAAIGQFEEAAAVVFLFSLGNALQGYTLDKTRNSIRALMDLTPPEALVNRNGILMSVPVGEIGIESVIIVRPGERIPMDGRVIKGFSSVNQAPITGESVPVEKNIGDEVYAGTINERGSLDIQVTRLAQDNTIARIIEMVEEAQGQRAPSQQFVDRFAKYYTPAVIIGAALVAAVPTLIFGQPFHKWFYEAMAMLLVACPCALVISTPVSIASAIGSAAQSGVLIKGGIYLEEAGALSVIAFDKTGTLTAGKPQVTDVIPLNGYSAQELIGISSAIELRSEHPLGEAIINYARDQKVNIPVITNFEAVAGKGARADVDGKPYKIGNVRFFTDLGIDLGKAVNKITALQNEGKTVMVLGNGNEILGLLAVADVIRNNTRLAIESLKRAGIKKIVMLTGDNHRTAQAIAAKAGIDEFKADLLPEDKVYAMRELMAQNQKVAMVGDGINDAPAMAVSTVGIAMGVAGTDAALETADIALMADDLSKLAYTIKLSHKTLRIIKQNITFALVIKGLILLLVIPGWLTLWLAVAGDMGSSLLVTLNGMRLLRMKDQV